MLFHIAYASTAVEPFDQDQLLEIMRRARPKNEQLGISGMLLHQEGHFFQVIEGPHQAVLNLYQTIERDPRHHSLVKIIEEPLFQRDFAQWSMGLANMDAASLRSIEGLNDFFQNGTHFQGLNPGRASKLLQAFRQGRWRKQVSGVLA